MTLVLVLVLLLAVASLVATNRKQAWGRPVLIVATIAALGLGSWSMISRMIQKTPAAHAMDVQTEAGKVLAEEMLKEAGGGRVLVLTYAPVKGQHLFTDLRLAGFTKALEGKGVEVTLAGPLMTPDATPEGAFTVWPQETLGRSVAEWLGQNKDAKAVVSLMPFPPRDLSTRSVPLFAFAVHEMPEWQAGVRAGSTKAVLVSRPTVMKAEASSKAPTWQEMFELVTPQNVRDYKPERGY